MFEKFVFNHDFGKPKPPMEEKIEPTYTEDQVNAMRELAYSKGLEEGKTLQQQAIETNLAKAVGEFKTPLVKFVNSEAEKRRQVYHEAAQLAKTVALKICLTDSEKNSVDRVVICMEMVMQALLTKPTVAISVNPKLSQPLSDRIRDLIATGDIQIKTDESLSLMDCRFSWATGGAEVVLKNTLDEVDRLINEISHTKENEDE